MANRRVVVKFLGEDKSLSKTADLVGSKTSRLGSRMAKVGKIAGLGLAAGAGLAAVALVKMTKAAAEDQQSQALLARQLKTSAGATKGQVAAVESWISAQGRALGVTDEQLRPALAKLVRATGDVGKAQKLASLAMNVSAGTGKDLGAVSTALAKAQNGNVSGLARLGIATKDVHGKTLSLTQITKNLGDTFGGAAATKANTLQGKMARLKLIFDEAQESIGAKLIPIVTKLADWFINKGVPAISKFTAELRDKLGPVFEKIRAIVSRVMGGMHGDVGKNLGAIKSIFASVVSIITSLWNRFGGTLTALAVAAFKNLRAIIGGALQVIAGIFKVVSSLLKGDWKGVWDGIKQILRGAWTIIKAVIRQGWADIKAIFKLAGSALRAIFAGIWSGIKALARAELNALISLVRGIPGKLKGLGGVFKGAGAFLIHQFVAGIKNAAGIISGIAGNVWNAVRSLLNGAISRINSALNFTISLPGPDLRIHAGNIPHLAKGGIVRARQGGTLALLGEAGSDEAVIPLSGRHAPRGARADTRPIIVQLVLDGKVIHQSLVKRKRETGMALGLA